jgi:hypothetical protein
MDTTINESNKVAAIILFLFAVICTIIGRSFTAFYPEYSDAMLFAYIGEQWTLGNIPYIDVWDHKPPGIFTLIAVVFSLLPRSFIALSIAEGLFVLGAIASVYALMREFRAPWSSTVLATASVAIMINLMFYNERGLLTEIYMLFPMTLSILFFCKGLRLSSIRLIIISGLLCGIASTFNPKGLTPFLSQIVFLVFLYITKKYNIYGLASNIIANTFGVILAWSPFIIYFIYHDAGMALLDASLLFNIEYGALAQPSLPSIVFNSMGMIQPVATLFITMLLGGIVFLKNLNQLQITGTSINNISLTPYYYWLLILIWVCGDLAGALAGGRNYPHYFLALAPSLSVAAGFAYWRIMCSTDETTSNKLIRQFVILLIILPLLFPLSSDIRRIWRIANDGVPNDYWVPVVKYLETVRQEGDTLFTWDYLPALYYNTDMNHVTRHLDARHRDIRESIANEVMSSLERYKPTYIIEKQHKSPQYSESPIEDRYKTLISNEYTLVNSISKLNIYAYNKALN